MALGCSRPLAESVLLLLNVLFFILKDEDYGFCKVTSLERPFPKNTSFNMPRNPFALLWNFVQSLLRSVHEFPIDFPYQISERNTAEMLLPPYHCP